MAFRNRHVATDARRFLPSHSPFPIPHSRTNAMQRWIKLPDGRFIDANRVAFISKPETFARIDEDGNDLGLGYSVNLGTDFPRESQINVTGSKDEVYAVLRGLLGPTPAGAAAGQG
jgi:hypothetical protein